MIYPKILEKGFSIGVTATSSGFDNEVDINRLESAIGHFEKLGYLVKETENVRTDDRGRSSDGRSRAAQLMQLYHDQEVRAIIAASGGDYLVEMLSYIDWDSLLQDPKWFQGFSDNTGLTFTLTTNLDIATIYSYNFSSFGMKNWHQSLIDNVKILEGEDRIQKSFELYQNGYRKRITGLEEFDLDTKVKWSNIHSGNQSDLTEINMQGRALGGCLDVLLSLIGTRFDKTKEFIHQYKEDGILWFLESYDLNSEALVRGLWQLKEAGWFQNAKGFIFGRPAMYTSGTDTSYEEAVLSVLEELDLPIILDADIGHMSPQVTMINGAIAQVHSNKGIGTITFERR